jgi:hypothetical protein
LTARGLLIGVVLLPAMLLGVVAWLDYVSVFDQALKDVQSTTRVFEESAHNVFDTHKLVARLVDQRIRGMSWDEISASEALHQYLDGVVHEYPKMQSLWLVDPSGIVRNSSAVFPTPRLMSPTGTTTPPCVCGMTACMLESPCAAGCSPRTYSMSRSGDQTLQGSLTGGRHFGIAVILHQLLEGDLPRRQRAGTPDSPRWHVSRPRASGEHGYDTDEPGSSVFASDQHDRLRPLQGNFGA